MEAAEQGEVQLDPCYEEIESFRWELESKLEKQKTEIKIEIEEAMLKIGTLSENSLKSVESEWEGYEKLLEAKREEILNRSREEINRLLESRVKADLEEARIPEMLGYFLPEGIIKTAGYDK
jgi:hypothetical protein